MKRYLLPLIAAALLSPAAALAAPTPTVTAVTATGVAATSTGQSASTNEVAVAWTLGQDEYACALTLSTPEAERTFPLAPTSTGFTETIAARAGETITVTLAFVDVSPATLPENACYQARATMTATAPGQDYAATTPPAAGDPPPPTSTTDAPPAPAADPIADLQAQIEQLRKALEALTARVEADEKASDAAWLAYQQAVEAGADPASAAAAARSTYENAIYGLGDYTAA